MLLLLVSSPSQLSIPLHDNQNPFRLPRSPLIFLLVYLFVLPQVRELSLSVSQVRNPFPNQLSHPNPSRIPIPSSLITPSSLPVSLLLVHLSPVLPQRTLLAPKSRLPLRSTNWCLLLTQPSYIGSAVVVPNLLLPRLLPTL